MAESQDMLALRAKQEAYKKQMMEAGLRAKQDAFKGQMRAAAPEKPFVSPLANQGRPDFVSNQAGTTARPNQSFSREVATVAGQSAKTVPGTGVVPVKPTVQSTVRPDPGTMYSNSSGATLQGAQPSSNTGLRTVGQPQFSGNVYEGELEQPKRLDAPAQQARSTPSPDPDYQKLAAEKTEAAQSKQGPANARAADAAEELKRSGQRTATQAALDTPEARAKRGFTPEVDAAKAGTPTPEVKTSKLSRAANVFGKGTLVAGAGFSAYDTTKDVLDAPNKMLAAERVGEEASRWGGAWAGAKAGAKAGGKNKYAAAGLALGGAVAGGFAPEAFSKVTGRETASELIDMYRRSGGSGAAPNKYSDAQYADAVTAMTGQTRGTDGDMPIANQPTNEELDAYLDEQGTRPFASTEAQRASREASMDEILDRGQVPAKQGIPAEAQAGIDAENEDPSTTPEAQVNKYDVLGNEGLRRKDLNAKTYKEGDQVNFGSFGGVTDGGITGTADANGRMNSFTGRGLQQPQQQGGLGGMFGSQSPYASSGNPGGVSDAELAIGRFGRANAIRQQTLNEEAQRSGGGRMTVVGEGRAGLERDLRNAKVGAGFGRGGDPRTVHERGQAHMAVGQARGALRDFDAAQQMGGQQMGGQQMGGQQMGGQQAGVAPKAPSIKDQIAAQKAAYDFDEHMANRGLRDRTEQFKQSASELENANAVKAYTQDVITDAYASSNNNAEIPPERLRAIYTGMKSAKGIPVGVGPDGKEIMMRVNELDPLSSDYHDAATRAVHFDNAKNVFREFLQEHGLKASAVDEPGFFERLSVNTKGGGINQNVVFGAKPYSVAERTMNRLFGSGNSVTLQGANRGKNVDMMYDDLMERMDAAGATDYFKEVLGQ